MPNTVLHQAAGAESLAIEVIDLQRVDIDAPILTTDHCEAKVAATPTSGQARAANLHAPPYRDLPGYAGHDGHKAIAAPTASGSPSPSKPRSCLLDLHVPRLKSDVKHGDQAIIHAQPQAPWPAQVPCSGTAEGSAGGSSGAGAPAAQPQPGAAPAPYIRCNVRISGAQYECDEVDDAFIAALHSGHVTRGRQVATWEPALKDTAPPSAAHERGPKHSTRTSHGSVPVAALNLAVGPLVLEDCIIALEQHAFACAGRALTRAIEAESAQAAAAARAHTEHLLASATKRRRIGSSASASSDGPHGTGEGHSISARSARTTTDDTLLMQHASIFFLPALEGRRAVLHVLLKHGLLDEGVVASITSEAASALDSSPSSSTSAGTQQAAEAAALSDVMFEWWLRRRREEVGMRTLPPSVSHTSAGSGSGSGAGAGAGAGAGTGASGSTGSSSAQPLSKAIEESHRSYLLRCLQGLGKSDIPPSIDMPLELMGVSVLGMYTPGLQAMAREHAQAFAYKPGQKGWAYEEEQEGGSAEGGLEGDAADDGGSGSDDDDEHDAKDEQGGSGAGSASKPPQKKRGKKPTLSADGIPIGHLKAHVDESARALLRARMLRAHLERLRMAVDLVRRREKLKRARLVAIDEFMEIVASAAADGSLPPGHALPTGHDVFGWSEQAAWGPPGTEASKGRSLPHAHAPALAPAHAAQGAGASGSSAAPAPAAPLAAPIPTLDLSSAAVGVGDRVECRFRGKGKKWYAGTVTVVHTPHRKFKEDTYGVQYDDGDKEAHVLPCNMRRAVDMAAEAYAASVLVPMPEPLAASEAGAGAQESGGSSDSTALPPPPSTGQAPSIYTSEVLAGGLYFRGKSYPVVSMPGDDDDDEEQVGDGAEGGATPTGRGTGRRGPGSRGGKIRKLGRPKGTADGAGRGRGRGGARGRGRGRPPGG